MKFVTFTHAESSATPSVGVLTDAGVVDVGHLLPTDSRREPMIDLIDHYDRLRPELLDAAATGAKIAIERITLHAPIRRPGKIVCCIGNYWEHAEREPRPLNMFLKSPDSVLGPEGTVRLPATRDPWVFMHEAELGVVVKGTAKDVSEPDWLSAVFGYTCLIDITARGEGRMTWRSGSWLGKSFDTFGPIGPCLVTAEEIPDPHRLHVRMWNDDELRHDYSTSDMEHRVPEIVAFASHIMTLHSGDVLACGTNHEGLGAVQDGERLVMEISGIGRMSVTVSDPLGRKWERGVYLGADSTNHEAVRRHRPQEAHLLRDSS
ncbi:fumarylacetoacetate hydrolase family protein [Catenulispora sp. NF23]|uniref:fumarylacetoacetate hydrolase family protein n=1 Tax=Catenulispora pinistramenti TaxID=2705254 RepID=UPI001BAB56E2|nr:fumarylacetoacetate hydrolase family protein [Catenulispora pinistramenti]MBS2531249.1 fumarylacetoacetate hydrolase family protein [Catenulispora pinistramenti]